MPVDSEIRSFIAIELSDEAKVALTDLQAKLKLRGHTFVKVTAPEGIHLTLKFLGNIAVGKIPDIVEAMEKSAKGISPLKLKFHELGAFPDLRQPRVLWVGVGGETDRLIDLQQRIDQALIPLGFVPESRPFSPHLTLARLRETASSRDKRSLGELVQKTPCEVKCSMQANTVSLMRSQLFPTGAVYTRLAEVELGK